MKRYKRILIFALALLLCLPIASCSGCNEMEKPVATCAGYDVLYEELRYLVLLQKDIMKAQYGEHIFDTPESAEQYRAELEAAVLEMLKENYAVLAACNHYLPDLEIDDKEIQQEVDAYIKESAAQLGGEEEFFKMSEENYHMTENFIRFSAAVAIMEDRLRVELAARGIIFADNQPAEFFNWIRNGNGVYVQHLFIRNDPGEDVEANRETAETVRRYLKTGQITLNEAIGSAVYNQDTSNLSPYYLIRDVYDPTLEAAALALADQPAGAVSDVVETETGFYVFVLIEDSDDMLNRQLPSLLNSYQWAKTEEVKNTFRNSLVFEWTKFGKELDWLAIE